MKICDFSRRKLLTIRGMSEADNKENHNFHSFEADSDSFVQVNIIIFAHGGKWNYSRL